MHPLELICLVLMVVYLLSPITTIQQVNGKKYSVHLNNNNNTSSNGTLSKQPLFFKKYYLLLGPSNCLPTTSNLFSRSFYPFFRNIYGEFTRENNFAYKLTKTRSTHQVIPVILTTMVGIQAITPDILTEALMVATITIQRPVRGEERDQIKLCTRTAKSSLCAVVQPIPSKSSTTMD